MPNTITLSIALFLLACAANPPVIKDFPVAKSTVSAGESTVLLWQVVKADTITINNGVRNIDFVGNTEIKPATSPTYRIVASNKVGNIANEI